MSAAAHYHHEEDDFELMDRQSLLRAARSMQDQLRTQGSGVGPRPAPRPVAPAPAPSREPRDTRHQSEIRYERGYEGQPGRRREERHEAQGGAYWQSEAQRIQEEIQELLRMTGALTPERREPAEPPPRRRHEERDDSRFEKMMMVMMLAKML